MRVLSLEEWLQIYASLWYPFDPLEKPVQNIASNSSVANIATDFPEYFEPVDRPRNACQVSLEGRRALADAMKAYPEIQEAALYNLSFTGGEGGTYFPRQPGQANSLIISPDDTLSVLTEA